jgi:hypothetical protein
MFQPFRLFRPAQPTAQPGTPAIAVVDEEPTDDADELESPR